MGLGRHVAPLPAAAGRRRPRRAVPRPAALPRDPAPERRTRSRPRWPTAPPGPWDGPRQPAPGRGSLFDDAGPAVAPDPLAELQRQLAARRRRRRARPPAPAARRRVHGRADRRRDAARRPAVERRGPRRAAHRRCSARGPAAGGPAKLEALADEVRAALGQPTLNLDSQPDLLRGLRSAGCDVESTRTWELKELDHPVTRPAARVQEAVPPAQRQRLGVDGRVGPRRPVPPRLRARRRGHRAVGHQRRRGAAAARAASARPCAPTRAGSSSSPTPPSWSRACSPRCPATPPWPRPAGTPTSTRAWSTRASSRPGPRPSTRCSARSTAPPPARARSSCPGSPRRTRGRSRWSRPAPRAGERGEVVSTWLGRTSPRPDAAWQAELAAASAEGAGADDVRAARRRGRDWGRFTRNFVVQGTAAEWALCWMASLRRRLAGS